MACLTRLMSWGRWLEIGNKWSSKSPYPAKMVWERCFEAISLFYMTVEYHFSILVHKVSWIKVQLLN